MLDRLKQGVLADSLRAAEHQCVVDLVAGMLPVMRQPANDVVGVVGIDSVRRGRSTAWLCCVSPGTMRGARYMIEADRVAFFDPATGDHQPVVDEHRQTGMPGSLFHAAIVVDPFGGGMLIGLPFLSRFGWPLLVRTGTRGRRALTLEPGHSSRQGMKK